MCGMEFPEGSAEELGAESVVRGGKRVWFCSAFCKHEFEKTGR